MSKDRPKIPDKKSFLLYCDQAELIRKLSDEQAGNLIKQIFSYCGNGRTRPEIPDPLTDIVFTALQTSLDRDHLKYLKIVERNRNNGQLGGRPKNNPMGSLGTQKTQANPENPSEPDSDSDSDSDSDNGKAIIGEFKKPACIPKDYSIEENHIKYALSKKLNDDQAKDQFEAFVIHHTAKGTKFKSWYAAYQNWVRNSIKFKNVVIADNKKRTNAEILA